MSDLCSRTYTNDTLFEEGDDEQMDGTGFENSNEFDSSNIDVQLDEGH